MVVKIIKKRKFGPKPTRKYSEWKRAYLRERTIELIEIERLQDEVFDDAVFRIVKEWKAKK